MKLNTFQNLRKFYNNQIYLEYKNCIKNIKKIKKVENVVNIVYKNIIYLHLATCVM